MKFKQPKTILLGLFSLFLLYSCGSGANKEFDLLKEKYNCENIDDCLSKYNFEAARAFNAKMNELDIKPNGKNLYSSDKEKNMVNILSSETTFLLSNDEFEKALSVLESEKNVYGGFGNDYWKDRYNLISSVVAHYLDNKQYDNAKKWALKASNERNNEGWLENETHEWNPKKIQQKILLQKIDDYKKEIQ